MSMSGKKGFTIVEVIMFFAITGLLIAGFLVNTGGAISTQRYRDSVYSLQSFLQKQYTDVYNVYNEGVTLPSSCFPTGYDGQSACVLLGRIIRSVSGDNTKLTIKYVFGKVPSSTIVLPTDDINIFKTAYYNARIFPTVVIEDSEYSLEWGSRLVRAAGTGTGTPAFSILILRSPTSGVARTFIDKSHIISDSNIQSIINSTYIDSNHFLTVCIDSNSVYSGAKRAIKINANASTASGVELLTEKDSATLCTS